MTEAQTKKNKIASCLAAIIVMLLIAAMLAPMTVNAANNNPLTISIKQFFSTSSNSVSKTFTYRLEPLDSGNPMPSGYGAGGYSFTIAGTAAESIGPISFSREGVYRYKLYQVIETQQSYYTYDRRVYTINVHVGTALDVNVVVYYENGDKAPEITFENSYYYSGGGVNPPPTPPTRPSDPDLMVDPPVIKRVSGNPGGSSVFTFKLVAKNFAYPMPAGSVNGVKTIYITGSGTKEFGTWSYDNAGIYAYTVYEADDKISGYTYDSTVYTITDTVTEKDGQLVVSRVVTDDKNYHVAAITFTNKYGSGDEDIVPPEKIDPPKPIDPPWATTPPDAAEPPDETTSLGSITPLGTGTTPADETDPTKRGQGGDGPKTGDDSNEPLYATLFGLGGVTVTAALYFLFGGEKKRKKVR